MSSNYEWQKHQVNERVQACLQEAVAHRRAKQGSSRSPLARPLKVLILVAVGVIVAIWLLTGCTTTTGTIAAELEIVAAIQYNNSEAGFPSHRKVKKISVVASPSL